MNFRKEPTCPAPKYRRLPRRRRKTAPLWLRLLKLLQPRAKRSKAIWLYCPSYRWLAEYFGVSEGAISRAFHKLEGHQRCPLKFRSAYAGKGNTRKKMFALKEKLRFDEEPLFLREDGRSRGIRESFRREAALVEPGETPATEAAAKGENAPQPEQADPQPESAPENEGQTKQKTPRKKPGGYFRFCFKDKKKTIVSRQSIPTFPTPLFPAPAGLSGVIPKGVSRLDLFRSLPADFDVNLLPPPPEDWEKPPTPNAMAWRHAREALQDGELFYDNRKTVMPLPSLRTLLLPAFEQGMDWRERIRPALLHALRQAHNAACLGEVCNPGGMAAVIFRERLGLSVEKTSHRRRRQVAGKPVPGGKIRNFTVKTGVKLISTLAEPQLDKAAARTQLASLAAAMRAGLAKTGSR